MKKIIVLSIVLASSSSLLANMYPKIGFEPFPNHYFVETGTFGGQGVLFAVRAGFPEIYSIEIDQLCYKDAIRRLVQCPKVRLILKDSGVNLKGFGVDLEKAKRRIGNCSNVHLVLGDSGVDLWNVIKDLDKPITFWLDGHCGVARTDGGKNTPLLKELDQIKWHHIKTHTLVIDDMHCCGDILFDHLTRDDIIAKIKEINPDYEISYIPGGDDGEVPNNIMIARVSKKTT